MKKFINNYFTNIGERIKKMAIYSFTLFLIAESIAAVIFGFGMFDYSVALGLLIVVLGPFVAFFVNATIGAPFYMLIYGFGELIDKTSSIESSIVTSGTKSVAQTEADIEKRNKLEKLRAKGIISEEEFKKALTGTPAQESDELPTL